MIITRSKKKILVIVIKIVIVIIREIVREAIVEIEVLLTTIQGKRRDSSTTLRKQAATPKVIKKRIQKITAIISKGIKTNQIKRPDPGGKAECSSTSKAEGSNWDVQ